MSLLPLVGTRSMRTSRSADSLRQRYNTAANSRGTRSCLDLGSRTVAEQRTELLSCNGRRLVLGQHSAHIGRSAGEELVRPLRVAVERRVTTGLRDRPVAAGGREYAHRGRRLPRPAPPL